MFLIDLSGRLTPVAFFCDPLAVFPQFLAGVAEVVAVRAHAELVRVRVDALRAGRGLDLPSERALQDLGGRQLVEDDVA